MPAQAPEEAAAAGAVAVFGLACQVGAFDGLAGAAAFHRGGVRDPYVVAPHRGDGGQDPVDAPYQAGGLAQPLAAAGLPGQAGEEAAQAATGTAEPSGLGGDCRWLIHRCSQPLPCTGSYRVKVVFECLVCLVMRACAGSLFPRVPSGRLLPALRHTGSGRPWPAAAICAVMSAWTPGASRGCAPPPTIGHQRPATRYMLSADIRCAVYVRNGIHPLTPAAVPRYRPGPVHRRHRKGS